MSTRYRLHGCTVSSDLPFHLPQVGASHLPEMTLRRSGEPLDMDWEATADDVLARVGDATNGFGYMAARTPNGYRLRFRGLCDFDVSIDLREVTWTMWPDRDPATVSVLAAGALMSFILTVAGNLVLHASAVRVRGRGLAFVGASGMGKSTLATLMCAGGAILLTDDVARVTFDGQHAVLWPGSTESRLRPAAAALAQLLGDDAVTRLTGDGRTALSLPSWTAGDPVALDAVVVPIVSRQSTELVVTGLSPAQALILLGQFPRIPGWIDPHVLANQFDLLADLVGRVPTYLAVVPWGHSDAVHTAPRLLDELGWTDEEVGEPRSRARASGRELDLGHVEPSARGR